MTPDAAGLSFLKCGQAEVIRANKTIYRSTEGFMLTVLEKILATRGYDLLSLDFAA